MVSNLSAVGWISDATGGLAWGLTLALTALFIAGLIFRSAVRFMHTKSEPIANSVPEMSSDYLLS